MTNGLLVEAELAQRSRRLDGALDAREVAAPLELEHDLAVFPSDRERPIVMRVVMTFALCRLPGYAA
jgi:hypothetical protein